MVEQCTSAPASSRPVYPLTSPENASVDAATTGFGAPSNGRTKGYLRADLLEDFMEGMTMLQRACQLMAAGLEPAAVLTNSLRRERQTNEYSQTTLTAEDTAHQHPGSPCVPPAPNFTDHGSVIVEPPLSHATSPSDEIVITPVLARHSPDRLPANTDLFSPFNSSKPPTHREAQTDLMSVSENVKNAFQEDRCAGLCSRRRSRTASAQSQTLPHSRATRPTSAPFSFASLTPSSLRSGSLIGWLSGVGRSKA